MERTEMQFVRAFGRLLLPRRFLLWNGGFYRIDAEEGLIWVVALDRPDDALCTVSYDVKAFCHGLNEAALRGGMYRVLGLRARYGAELRRMSEPEADAAVFRKLLLERFTQIGGLADLQAFRRWHYGMIGGTPGGENWLPLEAWECVQQGDCLRGAQLMQQAYDRWQDICRPYPELMDRPTVRAQGENYRALVELFAGGEAGMLQRRLEENVEASRAAIRSYFQRDDIV